MSQIAEMSNNRPLIELIRKRSTETVDSWPAQLLASRIKLKTSMVVHAYTAKYAVNVLHVAQCRFEVHRRSCEESEISK